MICVNVLVVIMRLVIFNAKDVLLNVKNVKVLQNVHNVMDLRNL